MTTFTIDSEYNITALTAEETAAGIPDGATPFTSDNELLRLTADWPAERLVSTWNSIPGVKAVTRFTSRKAGIVRIWKAIQPLARDAQPTEPATPQSKPSKASKRAKKPAKKAAPAKKASASGSERSNKKAEVIAMMKRAKGVTLAEIMEATGWQKHTVRGFVSILGSKGGQKTESTKSPAGERTYRIAR